MSIQQGRIDVHHHLIPPAFVQEMQRRGITEVASTPLPKWTPEKSIEVMDTRFSDVGLHVRSLNADKRATGGAVLLGFDQMVGAYYNCGNFLESQYVHQPKHFHSH
jgi:hypothetical protein